MVQGNSKSQTRFKTIHEKPVLLPTQFQPAVNNLSRYNCTSQMLLKVI